LGAVLLVAGQSVFADPITLLCANITRPDFSTLTVDLDEAQGLATVNWPTSSIPNGAYPPIIVAAYSSGPLKAKFDPKSVTFDENRGEGYIRYTIDRLTGELLQYQSHGAPWDQVGPNNRVLYRHSCRVGKTQF
jgi:hypothetical protein